MILLWIIIPLIGGLSGWLLEKQDRRAPCWIAVGSLAVDALLLAYGWSQSTVTASVNRGAAWLMELHYPWIPQFGISLHLAADGLSIIFILLTLLLGIIAVLCSRNEIRDRTGFFHVNLLCTLSGIIGVFTALDLFLFYFFWELMLVPMYFLINIWGNENRVPAAFKFFIFTQAGGLFMLVSILSLYFMHGIDTGLYTFDYSLLLGTSLTPKAAFWIMLGFIAAFAVKLPAFPLHPWLPDAYTQAPTAGSVVLAGLLSKTAAYGLLRFVLPFFPESAMLIAPWLMIIAVISIIYGSALAFAQTDLKRLVAYTSVAHMGFVLLGIFAANLTSLSGVVIQIVAHGISVSALFIMAGLIQERINTRDLAPLGGFWKSAPRLSGIMLIFALASLGLPGFGNFTAEFLILVGAYRANPLLTGIAAFGLVLAVIYSLRIVQSILHGEQKINSIPDLTMRETGILTIMVAAILWLGLYPRPVLNISEPGLHVIQSHVQQDRDVLSRGAAHE